MGDLFAGLVAVLATLSLIAILIVVSLSFAKFPLGWQKLSLDEFGAAVEGVVGMPRDRDTGWFPRLERLRFQGPLPSGRLGFVRFFATSQGSETRSIARVSVNVRGAPSLRVTRETPTTAILKTLGLKREIVVGDRGFDARFLLETDEPARAKSVLVRLPELRGRIDALFSIFCAQRLAFEHGVLTIDFDISDRPADDLQRALQALDETARLLDRRPMTVRVLGGERRALVDSGGKTRCPYCRAGIDGQEETLVACEACATVLHDECWREHGGCPILGCRGRQPERRRAR